MPVIAEILLREYQCDPDRVCLVIQHAGKPDREITVRELCESAAGWAKTYRQAGLAAGDVVVLILQHGAELIFAYWGAAFAGLIPSIMPFLTEKLLPERYRADLAALAAVTCPAGIVTYPEFADEVRLALADRQDIKAILLSDQAYPAEECTIDHLDGIHKRKEEDIFLLQHSSGTTGLQKGVALSHIAILKQLESYCKAIRLSEQDVIVSWLPLYHDMGLIAGFLLPLLNRVKLVLMSPFDWVRAPWRLFQAIFVYKGTLCWLPNFAYNFCAQKVRDSQLDHVELGSLRAVINCSEPMRQDSHTAFYERFHPYGLQKSALCTCYAMAENVFAVTQGGIESAVTVEAVDLELLQIEKKAVPVPDGRLSVQQVSAGKPIDGVQVKIVDETGNELSERHVGEICITSQFMLSEYYHRADVTALALRNGWYSSGDLGYIANGEIYITGRKKDLLIVGGKNIYPQDIEYLAMQVSGIHAGRLVVFGIDNPDTGTQDVILIAEVDGLDEDAREELELKIRETVTRGSAVALKKVLLVDPPWIIKTSSGKTARSANRQKYLDQIKTST